MNATTATPTATMTDTARRTFRAMGCLFDVQLIHIASPEADTAAQLALSATEARVAIYDEELTRFRETSGLSVLNRSAGSGPMSVSPLLAEVTHYALAAAEATDGLFDPTLGTVLARLGYDRSFPFPNDAGGDLIPVVLPHHRANAWREIRLDPVAKAIALPADVALDFGGIGKGWTVDRLVAKLRHVYGVRGGLVNAGGDLRVWGEAPDESAAWTVGVENPRDLDLDCALLSINDRAVATSSIAYRRWKRGYHWIHHLLDPHTGQPAVTDLASVTVIGPSTMWAEIHAKVALLSGLESGRAYVAAQHGYDGLLITIGGTQVRTAGMGVYRS